MEERSIKEIASRICNEGCISPFACERKKWQKNGSVPQPVFGKGTECPVLQFEAEEDTDKRPWYEKPLQQFNVSETWLLCQECKYSEIDNNGYISNEAAFTDYCMDCPVMMIRENLQETMAEAWMS